MRDPTAQEMADAAALVEQIDTWLETRGHTRDRAGAPGTRSSYGGTRGAVTISWDGESGFFIDHWGEALGAWPTAADGFTPAHLRKAPKP